MATREAFMRLNTEELCEFLTTKLGSEVAEETVDAVRSNRISARSFLDLKEDDLKELTPLMGDRKAMFRLIKSYSSIVVSAEPSSNSQSGSAWLHKFKIPEQFSKRTQQALQTGTITRHARIEIVTSMATHIIQYTEYPSSREYVRVCEKLVERFPVLKDTIGNGIGSWKEQLQQKFRNIRRPVKREREEVEKENNEEENNVPSSQPPKKKRLRSDTPYQLVEAPVCDDYGEKLEMLKKEGEKNPQNKKYLRQLMKDTFSQRHRWIADDQPELHQVLELFPCFKKSSYLQREFKTLLKGVDPFKGAKSSWEIYIPKIKHLANEEAKANQKLAKMLQEQAAEVQSFDGDNETVADLGNLHIFMLLISMLMPRTTKTVIHRFSPTSNVEDELATLGEGNNHPVVGVKATDSVVQYVLIVERQILVNKCDSFLEAINDMMSAYYMFDFVYPPPLYPLLIFIQRFVMDIKDKQRVPPCVARLCSSLDKITL